MPVSKAKQAKRFGVKNVALAISMAKSSNAKHALKESLAKVPGVKDANQDILMARKSPAKAVIGIRPKEQRPAHITPNKIGFVWHILH